MERIHILFVQHKLVCGGAEQALFDLIGLLDKNRFEAKVFVQNPGGEWEQKFRDAGIALVYDYSCRQPTWNPIKKLGNLSKKFRIRKAYQGGGGGLLEVCLPHWADIVVSYNVWYHEELVFAKNAKTVKYIHGDPGTNPDYRNEAENHRELLSRFDRIVCVSRSAGNAFRQISGLTQGVELHYNPMNSENVRRLANEEADLPDSNLPYICAVGRLSAEKAFERLIVIHKRLLDRGIAHRLVIVGDGPDGDFLRRLIRAMGLEDTVVMAGYQPNPYPYMKHSRFLVSSSYTEGLPVIAMEALCLGVPMVTPIDSVGEVFGGETCGLITENSNAALEDAIARMLTDEKLYQQMKQGAQSRSAFFDGTRMVREIEDLFTELAES